MSLPDYAYFLHQQPHSPTARDAIEIYAPERAEKRLRWAAHSRAARPDVLAWDYALAWEWLQEQGGTERLSEQLSALQYLRMDTRYTTVPTRREAFELMSLIAQELPNWAVVEHGQTPTPWEAVVYTTRYGGHVGRDKLRLRPEDQPTGLLASRFMPCDELPHGVREQLSGEWQNAPVTWSERDLVWGN
ncbi:hypothetical protein ACFP81_03670 [Deinococcus lacus]|uniref:Uncharacterized protein n=1 Tax=Deinococcus lacus TaxID=392561 RepID=A0ABW1YCS6_9DEIO